MQIVLVHGLGVSHRYIARLRLDALRPDLAGSTIDELTRSLEARLAAPSTLVANSVGCQVAVELSLRRPELVRSLLLIGPTWDPWAPTIPRQLLRLLNGSYREPPSLLPVLAWEYTRWGPRRMLRTARSMLAHPMAARLEHVRVPAIVLRGERDPVCGDRWARVAADAAKAELVEVPGAAHAVHWSHPDLVEELAHDLAER